MASARTILSLTNRILELEAKMRENDTMDQSPSGDEDQDCVDVDDTDVDETDTEKFVNSMKNQNTSRMTVSHIKTFREFLSKTSENRLPEAIPPLELDKYLASFYMTCTKADGSDYEPSSVTNMMCAINRYLREKKYGYNIYTATEFAHSRDVLKAKRKLLKQKGMGNVKNRASPLTEAEIAILYDKNLLGSGKKKYTEVINKSYFLLAQNRLGG